MRQKKHVRVARPCTPGEEMEDAKILQAGLKREHKLVDLVLGNDPNDLQKSNIAVVGRKTANLLVAKKATKKQIQNSVKKNRNSQMAMLWAWSTRYQTTTLIRMGKKGAVGKQGQVTRSKLDQKWW
jgi:hypothetical protein